MIYDTRRQIFTSDLIASRQAAQDEIARRSAGLSATEKRKRIASHKKWLAECDAHREKLATLTGSARQREIERFRSVVRGKTKVYRRAKTGNVVYLRRKPVRLR
jgi:hypothetical protein